MTTAIEDLERGASLRNDSEKDGRNPCVTFPEAEIDQFIDCPNPRCVNGLVEDEWPDRWNREGEQQWINCERCFGMGQVEKPED